MRRSGKLVASAIISLSLIGSSTAAVASAPAPASQAPLPGWTTLSMLNASGAAALGNAGVAAAQADVPPPARYERGLPTPPLPVILVWLAVIAVDIWILTKDDNDGPGVPNSPA